MGRLRTLLSVAACVCVGMMPTVAQAYHGPTTEDLEEFATIARRFVGPKFEGLKDVRVATNDHWASAETEADALTPKVYFERSDGRWQLDAGSTGCLDAEELHMPEAVGRELGACPAFKPSPVIPYTLFAFPSRSLYSVDPPKIDLAPSACAPRFSELRWTTLSYRHAVAVGLGRFPYFPTYETSCLEAPAHHRRVTVVASRSRKCEGMTIFTEIRWRGGGERGHYRTRCS